MNKEELFAAAIIANGGQIVVSHEQIQDAKNKVVVAEIRLVDDSSETVLSIVESGVNPYGACPYCTARVVSRERRPNGNDKCGNGHVYPSRLSRI